MLIGFDTETHLIRPGHIVPRTVCGTLACSQSIADLLVKAGIPRQGTDGWLGFFSDDQHGITYSYIFDRDAMRKLWPLLLDHHLVFHNASFDLQVMMAARPDCVAGTLAAVDADRIYDTVHREKLIALAHDQLTHRQSSITGKFGPSRFTLAELAARYLGVDLTEEKSDPHAWRLRYHELDGVPLARWPKEAVSYAVMDAVYALRIAHAQEETLQPEVAGWPTRTDEPGPLPRFRGECREVRADLALQLGASWGLRTDGEQVTKTLAAWKVVADKGREAGIRLGFVRPPRPLKSGPRKGGLTKPSVDRKAMQALIVEAYAAQGMEAPRTGPSKTYPEGQVQYSEDVLAASGHPDLKAYAKCLQYTNFLNKYGDSSKNPLRAGVTRPITYKISSLVRTGRTAARNPPIQQPPRKGGFRECFVPRPGFLFAAADYSAAELGTLAQVHLWWDLGDTMAAAIREGMDLHALMAVDVLNAEGYGVPKGQQHADLSTTAAIWTYDLFMACLVGAFGAQWVAVAEDYRQLSKALNFGLPGALAAETFVAWARKQYNVEITVERAKRLKALWLRRWPEMVQYFAIVKEMVGGFGLHYTAAQPLTGRIRGGCSFTSGCNTYFQGLSADGFKAAAWELAKRMYVASDSDPLSGCRMVLPLHDEFVLEVPRAQAHEAAMALADVMRDTMQVHTPDVPTKVGATLSERWRKGAKPVFVDGRLVPWEPPVVMKEAA